VEIGKIPNDLLKKVIIDKIKHTRNEIILKPQIGEDCTAVDFGRYICVLSSDPITGAANEIGRLAVHVSCNDVAACGAEPLGLLATLLAPPESTLKDLEIIMTQLTETADSLNVDIMGGHTEVTEAVTRFVVVTTAVGKVLKDKLITSQGAKEGDSIILTKTAGLEGTAIIAHDKEKELIDVIGKEYIEKAKSFMDDISVVKEGIIAGNFGASAMHDVTEGGILGAVWEIAKASHKGVTLFKNKIPIANETEIICKHYSIDPLKLISSGCMIITSNKGNELVGLLKENKVRATVIGHITTEPDVIMYDDDQRIKIDQPGTDELFKVV
jgi:hydrogenase expression/formation protein HypE